MGSAEIQGKLWGQAPRDWAELMDPSGKPLWEAMLDAAGVGKGTRFLDVGCGSGGASVLAAGRGAHVSGLDAAAPLIGVAKERLPDADLRVGDMEALPFDDGAFDAVFAANSLQYAEDKTWALREFVRVCAPDGRVVVAVWDVPGEADFITVFLHTVIGALPELPGGEDPFELSPPGVLAGLMEGAGMRVVDSGSAVCTNEFPDFETLWRGNMSAGPLQAVLGLVDEGTLKAAVRDAVSTFRVNGIFRAEGSFHYVAATP